MRLYTRTGAIALDDPEYGHFDADENGGFDFDDDLSDKLHRFAFRGKPAWETEVERQQRLATEELERRRDPATLQALVEQLTLQAAAGRAAAEPAPAPVAPVEDAPVAKQTRKRAAAKPPLDA
jgi:hypothetical protein